jgi:hypothetical protein
LARFLLRPAAGLNVRLAHTWNDPATGQRLTQWADESLRLLRPGADERIYANFQTYEASSGAAAVYSVNFARLAGIKHKYDPHNFSPKLEHSAEAERRARFQGVRRVSTLPEGGVARAARLATPGYSKLIFAFAPF